MNNEQTSKNIFTYISNFITHFLSLILIRNRVKYKRTSTNSFITYFFSLRAFRNKFYCRRISVDSLIKHIWSLIAIRNKFYCSNIIIRSLIAPFLDCQPLPEGSYEIGSVRRSFSLSVSFLGTGSLVFPETQHGVRGPYIVVCDSQIFWKIYLLGK